MDNNSTDDTSGVLEEFGSLLPLRCIVEEQLGLSHARNAAVSAARGDYIVFTDDDVLVDPQWLTAYFDAISRHPDASVFGGPIHPWFEGEPPSWLSSVFDVISAAYAARDMEGRDPPLSRRKPPYGANMAFRTDVIRDRPFDPSLGRAGKAMVGGEETQLIITLLADGRKGWWVSDARVRHFIPRERQTIRYLRNWYAGYGQMLVRRDPTSVTASRTGRPRWIWRELVVAELLFLTRRLTCPPTDWIENLIRASTARGQFREFGALQRRRRPS